MYIYTLCRRKFIVVCYVCMCVCVCVNLCVCNEKLCAQVMCDFCIACTWSLQTYIISPQVIFYIVVCDNSSHPCRQN